MWINVQQCSNDSQQYGVSLVPVQKLSEFGKTSVADCAVALGPAGFLQRSQEALRLVVLRYHVVPLYVVALWLVVLSAFTAPTSCGPSGARCLTLSLPPTLVESLSCLCTVDLFWLFFLCVLDVRVPESSSGSYKSLSVAAGAVKSQGDQQGS
jgi:hypothetical protein